MTGICILTETFHPVTGGGESQARAMAAGLAGAGYELCVMTRRNDKRYPKSERLGDVHIIRVAPTGVGQLRKWTLLLTVPAALLRHRRRYGFIIVSGFRILGIPAMLVAQLFGKQVILKADNMGEMSGEYFRDGLASIGLRPDSLPVRLFLDLRNGLLRRCHSFVAISSPLRAELEAHGVAASAIFDIPNSVDTERFCPANDEGRREIRRILGIPPDAFVVSYTGRLVSYKGLPLLLRVWRDVRAEFGEARLLLVGEGGLDSHNCETDLKAYVRDNDLAHWVRFAGSVGNVQEYLQVADVFVLPTEREAFGISLIEAMACGLAVIATDIGGIPDIVQNNVNGLLNTVNDYQQLRDSLVSLYADESLRQRLGRQARQDAVQKFSEPAIVQRYLRLLDDLETRDTADAGV